MKVKHKTRPSKDFPKEIEGPVPDSWTEKFVMKAIERNEGLTPFKELIVDLCKDYCDAVKEYKSTFHALDNLRFTCNAQGEIDGIFVVKVNDFVSIKVVNPDFLINVANVLAERHGTKDRAYKAVMSEIQRRVDCGSMYPDKGANAA